jgi:hypothetical protein
MLSKWRKKVRDGELVGDPPPLEPQEAAELQRLRDVEKQFIDEVFAFIVEHREANRQAFPVPASCCRWLGCRLHRQQAGLRGRSARLCRHPRYCRASATAATARCLAGLPIEYSCACRHWGPGCCGTPAHSSDPADAGSYSLRVGCLDQRAELEPHRQIWCQSSMSWSQDTRDVPRTAKQ